MNISDIRSIIEESTQIRWIEADYLTDSQKASLYQYMVLDGGVEKEEYDEWIKRFKYSVQQFNPKQIIKIFEKWGWGNWNICQCKNDEDRIKKIKRLQKKTNQYWPYVVGVGKNFKEWAKDEMNHGDGYHRLCLALRENRPVEFLFLKTKQGLVNMGEIRSIIKEIVDEAWLSDRLPSTNFSFQMGDREKTTQSYWIKPDGTEFRTTFRGHSDKANQILQAYPDKEKELREKDAQVILWEMGWVSLQITIPDAKAIVKHYINIPITSEQIRSLRNIATRFNDDQTHIKKIDIVYDATEHRDIILESVIDERLNFSDLYDDTDDERIAKSELPGMRVRPLQVTTNNDRDLWRFDYSYISSERSEYKQYGGKIGHKGHIYFFKEDIDPDDNLEDLDCMVDCDCKDFKYRWAYALAQDDASIVGNKSLNKSTGAPPVKTNPLGHQQLCKHLSALRKYVVTNIEKAMAKSPYRKRPMNIFEAMDELAPEKGKFVTGYYDKK